LSLLFPAFLTIGGGTKYSSTRVANGGRPATGFFKGGIFEKGGLLAGQMGAFPPQIMEKNGKAWLSGFRQKRGFGRNCPKEKKGSFGRLGARLVGGLGGPNFLYLGISGPQAGRGNVQGEKLETPLGEPNPSGTNFCSPTVFKENLGN